MVLSCCDPFTSVVNLCALILVARGSLRIARFPSFRPGSVDILVSNLLGVIDVELWLVQVCASGECVLLDVTSEVAPRALNCETRGVRLQQLVRTVDV